MSNHRLAQSVEVRRFVAVDQRCWLIAVGPDFIVAALAAHMLREIRIHE